MARANDAAFPTVTPDTDPAPPWMQGRLVIALERLPQAAYVWDDDDPEVTWDHMTGYRPPSIISPAYITPTVGAVSTPDNANLTVTSDITITAKIRATDMSAAVARYVACHRAQANSQLAWHLAVGSGGNLTFLVSATGSAMTTSGNLGALPDLDATWIQVRATLDMDDGAGHHVIRGYYSTDDGATFVPTSNVLTVNGTLSALFNSNSALTIGARIALDFFQGDISWCEMRTGLDPAAGTVMWRFDANERTGTGAGFTDPRGRVWTATNAATYTAQINDPGDPGTPSYVWDAPFIGSGYTDVWCDMASLELITGEPDGDQSYRTPYARLELVDPGDGRYQSRTVDGRLVYWSIGRRLAVWWQDPAGVKWWLFSGAIATWRDPLNTRVVTIEAYGCTGTLSAPIGQSWTAGTAGQLPRTRLQAILTALAATGIRQSFDLGDATLSVPAASDTLPYDEMRRVARSDGGIVFADTDDTLVYRDRRWRNGRTDQTSVPMWTDNICHVQPGATVLWDVTSADVDLWLAGRVRLVNNATPTPLVATATGSGDVPATVVYTHPDNDLWTTQAEGNALAAHLATERSQPRLALATAAVYLHDRRFDYWATTLDRRIGDVVRFQHEEIWTDPDRVDRYDLSLILTTIHHTITADTWLVELATSPAFAYTAVEEWDITALLWDSTSPLAVWR